MFESASQNCHNINYFATPFLCDWPALTLYALKDNSINASTAGHHSTYTLPIDNRLRDSTRNNLPSTILCRSALVTYGPLYISILSERPCLEPFGGYGLSQFRCFVPLMLIVSFIVSIDIDNVFWIISIYDDAKEWLPNPCRKWHVMC